MPELCLSRKNPASGDKPASGHNIKKKTGAVFNSPGSDSGSPTQRHPQPQPRLPALLRASIARSNAAAASQLTEGAADSTAVVFPQQLQLLQLQDGSEARITFIRGSKRVQPQSHPQPQRLSHERLPAAANAAKPNTAQHIQITSC